MVSFSLLDRGAFERYLRARVNVLSSDCALDLLRSVVVSSCQENV